VKAVERAGGRTGGGEKGVDRGGQEHEILKQEERVLKVTRNGVFGLSPGIELALVSSAEDARRFQLLGNCFPGEGR